MGTSNFIHWSCNSQWIGALYQMGKTTPTVWSLRGVVPGRAHRYPQSPTPLGPAGTPLVPALTHSTSGSVTGNNVRLGTSKDLSADHETRLRRSATANNTCHRVPPTSAQITITAYVRVPTYVIPFGIKIIGQFRRKHHKDD